MPLMYFRKKTIASIEYDPYWNNVVLSMPMNSSISDLKGHTVTVGGATVDNTRLKFGSPTIRCVNGQNIEIATGLSDFAYGSGDFTIEFWVYLGSGPNDVTQTMFAQTNLSISLLDGIFYGAGNRRFIMSDGTSIWFIGGLVKADFVGVWRHVALSKASGACRVFVDGVQRYMNTDASANNNLAYATTANINSADSLTIGQRATDTNITDMRITKGLARYTSNFAVPTTAHITYGASY